MTVKEILDIYENKPIWLNTYDAKVYQYPPKSNLFFYGNEEYASYACALAALETLESSGVINKEGKIVAEFVLDQMVKERNAQMNILRRIFNSQSKSMKVIYQGMCLHQNKASDVVELINGIRPEWVENDIEGLKLLLCSFAGVYADNQQKEVCEMVVKAAVCKMQECKLKSNKKNAKKNGNVIDSSKWFKKFDKNDDEDSDDGPESAD